jgi:hypothetical protein
MANMFVHVVLCIAVLNTEMPLVGKKKEQIKFERIHSQLAFLTLPFLGGISAEVCEISSHNKDFL